MIILRQVRLFDSEQMYLDNDDNGRNASLLANDLWVLLYFKVFGSFSWLRWVLLYLVKVIDLR